ncbi:MAG: HypC/HybG/HupF family hydrogenase formation chaperone [Planctomycetota bacterium]|nr:HypC/HybG/HupF family hydrogenase formation chaperone [Planctomycetota bacterium]
MCLSVPALLTARQGIRGQAELDGIAIDVDLTLVPEAEVGDYVLVHAGFAIQRYDAEEAQQTLRDLREVLGATEAQA